MLQALDGFIVILAVIFVFAIISFPVRPKKGPISRVDAAIPSGAVLHGPIPDTSAALKQAASGDKQEIKIYSTDQKVATPERAKEV